MERKGLCNVTQKKKYPNIFFKQKLLMSVLHTWNRTFWTTSNKIIIAKEHISQQGIPHNTGLYMGLGNAASQ